MDRRLHLGLTVTNFTNAGYADQVGDDFAQDTVRQNGRTAQLRLTWSF